MLLKTDSANVTQSNIGLGCWQLGSTSYGPVVDSEAKSIISLALSSNIQLFDTSPTYGNGLSETRLGLYLPKEGDFFVATKVGMLPHDNTHIIYDFSFQGMCESLYASKERLQVEYFDLVQLHSPSSDVIQQSGLAEKLGKVSEALQVRRWGISLKSPIDIPLAVKVYDWYSIQFNFSLMDQRILSFRQLLENRQFKTIARTPFNFGFLTRDFELDSALKIPGHQLANWNSEQLNSWSISADKFKSVAMKYGIHLDQLALRFILDIGLIDFVIPGATNKNDLWRNLETSILKPLTKSQLNELLEIGLAESAVKSPYNHIINGQ